MKLLPFVLLLCFFTSCKMLQKAGFEKRRYRSGFYHVSSGNHQKGPAVSIAGIKKTDKEQTLQLQNTKIFNDTSDTRISVALKREMSQESAAQKKTQTAKKTIPFIAAKAFHTLPPEAAKEQKASASTPDVWSGLFSGLTLEESLWMLAFLLLTLLFAFLLVALFPAIGSTVALILGGCLSLLTIIGLVLLFS
ncbi:MAG: hypothetical protein K0S33_2845 [Bacteroidetes bacterium]|jgi:hypothetical protein|nr:hypothetical protein [Bacteroidota bacterium]